jgi:hypothetical protein
MIIIPDLLSRNTESIFVAWNEMSKVLFRLELAGRDPSVGDQVGLSLAEWEEFVQEAREWLRLLVQRYLVDRQVALQMMLCHLRLITDFYSCLREISGKGLHER